MAVVNQPKPLVDNDPIDYSKFDDDVRSPDPTVLQKLISSNSHLSDEDLRRAIEASRLPQAKPTPEELDPDFYAAIARSMEEQKEGGARKPTDQELDPDLYAAIA